MIMDMARSCYTGFVRYLAGNTAVVTQARWYFAAPTALPFPGMHAFGSPIWDDPRITPSLGWITRPTKRNWDSGRRLNTSDGTRFAGPAAFFLDGADNSGGLPRGVNGTPIECLFPPFGLALGGRVTPVHVARGGVRWGGSLTPLPPPGFPCSYCAYTPATATVVISGCSGPVAFLDGTWMVSQVGAISPCLWTGVIPPTGYINLQRINASTWNVQIGDTASGDSHLYQAMVPDCITPFVATEFFPDPLFPPTVSVTFP